MCSCEPSDSEWMLQHVQFCNGTRIWQRFFANLFGELRKFWVDSENSGSTQKILMPENSSQKFLACAILCIQPTAHQVFQNQNFFLALCPENSGSSQKILGIARKFWVQPENSSSQLWPPQQELSPFDFHFSHAIDPWMKGSVVGANDMRRPISTGQRQRTSRRRSIFTVEVSVQNPIQTMRKLCSGPELLLLSMAKVRN